MASLLANPAWLQPPQFTEFGRYRILLFAAIILGLGLVLCVWPSGKNDRHDEDLKGGREPAHVPYSIPGIGNTLEYGSDIQKFFAKARTLFGPLTPITAKIAFQRFYLIFDPFHCNQILRRENIYSFMGVIMGIMKPLFGIPQVGLDKILEGPNDPLSYSNITSRMTRDFLVENSSTSTPPASSASSSAITIGKLEKTYLTNLAPALFSIKPGKTNLMDITAHLIAQASVPVLYGPLGMHTLPEVQNFGKDFDTWARGLTMLMSGLPQSVFARKPYLARQRIQKAMQQVICDPKRYASVSALVKNRIEAAELHGLKREVASQVEMGVVTALLSNSVPACFWMLARAFEDASVLEELRGEVSKGVVEKEDGNYEISIGHLNKNCTLLRSLWEEVLRYYQNSSQMRLVTEDSTIPAEKGSDELLLLRKGSIIQMPLRVAHVEPTIWGEDARAFKARRFVNVGGSVDRKMLKMRQDAYRPFGGGSHLCPGRFFAATEAFTYLATMVMFFEVDFEGAKVPEGAFGAPSLGIVHPSGEIEAMVGRRKGFEGAKWSYVK